MPLGTWPLLDLRKDPGLATPLIVWGPLGSHFHIRKRKDMHRGPDVKQNFVLTLCKSLKPGMVGNETGEREASTGYQRVLFVVQRS